MDGPGRGRAESSSASSAVVLLLLFQLLADGSRQESPDRTKVMLSAIVVLKEKGEPGAGFYRLAREEFGGASATT